MNTLIAWGKPAIRGIQHIILQLMELLCSSLQIAFINLFIHMPNGSPQIRIKVSFSKGYSALFICK